LRNSPGSLRCSLSQRGLGLHSSISMPPSRRREITLTAHQRLVDKLPEQIASQNVGSVWAQAVNQTSTSHRSQVALCFVRCSKPLRDSWTPRRAHPIGTRVLVPGKDTAAFVCFLRPPVQQSKCLPETVASLRRVQEGSNQRPTRVVILPKGMGFEARQ
jgi:hypothetical protein